MSVGTKRVILVGGIDVEIEVSDENQITEFFDLSKFSSDWHKKIVGFYHFSSLLKCLLFYYFQFIYDKPETNLETLGTYHHGNILHNEIQEFIQRKYGYSVIEYPIKDDFDTTFILKKKGRETTEEIHTVGKIDMLDTKKHSVDDIKSAFYLPFSLETLDTEKLTNKYEVYIMQVMVYAFFLNQTYFKLDPIKKMRIILVWKKDLTTKVITISYSQEKALYFYTKIRARSEYLHKCLRNGEEPEGETNIYCPSCKFLSICSKGKEYVADISEPVSIEKNMFKKEYPDNKAYIKRDGVWKETKLFQKFKEKLEKEKEKK